MMQNKEDGKLCEKVYNLNQSSGKQAIINQYNSLISVLRTQVDLYKKAIDKLNTALQLYHNTFDNLAQFFDISPLPGQQKDKQMQKLKIWLFSIQEYIIETFKERPKQVQKIIQVQKTIEVEKPVFIEKIVEVERPITVYQEIQKEVQKHIYIQKTVEVPIFVEKSQQKLCAKCSGLL